MTDSTKPTKPTRRRMALNALAVLDEAVAAADKAPIEMTPAVRLAIGWLLLDEIAAYWQAEIFTRALTKPSEAYIEEMDHYVRNRDMAIYLHRWREDAEKWRRD